MTRATLSCILLLVLGCAHQPPANTPADARFQGVQSRGADVMGVDQYTSMHVFENLADGGRILLVRQDTTDAAGTATIRAHLRSIADSFSHGNFSNPSAVHDMVVPGTETMARLRDRITYREQDRPGGGEVRITTTDPEALAAIRDFLAFQRMDHRAAGHEGMDHSAMEHPAQSP
ncbi:MAG: hypothetical protein ABI742_10300 [Gemmatimonadota bacterium]